MQSVRDPGVPPAPIVARQFEHELENIARFAGPAHLTNVRTIYFCAASLRNQARIVFGLTISQHAALFGGQRRTLQCEAAPLLVADSTELPTSGERQWPRPRVHDAMTTAEREAFVQQSRLDDSHARYSHAGDMHRSNLR